ncbi:MAG: HypC/HybG/HupF family hydrogenase formation chaperone [Aureliella sp.]
MCLGIPGKIERWLERDPLFATALIDFNGAQRICHLACVPDAEVGDYVIVHAGIAICRVDQAEAERALAEFERLQWMEQDYLQQPMRDPGDTKGQAEPL